MFDDVTLSIQLYVCVKKYIYIKNVPSQAVTLQGTNFPVIPGNGKLIVSGLPIFPMAQGNMSISCLLAYFVALD